MRNRPSRVPGHVTPGKTQRASRFGIPPRSGKALPFHDAWRIQGLAEKSAFSADPSEFSDDAAFLRGTNRLVPDLQREMVPMRAIRAENFGGYQDLKLVDVPVPVVSEGRVLVRVMAAG